MLRKHGRSEGSGYLETVSSCARRPRSRKISIQFARATACKRKLSDCVTTNTLPGGSCRVASAQRSSESSSLAGTNAMLSMWVCARRKRPRSRGVVRPAVPHKLVSSMTAASFSRPRCT